MAPSMWRLTKCWFNYVMLIPLLIFIVIVTFTYKTLLKCYVKWIHPKRSLYLSTLGPYDTIFAVDDLHNYPLAANATIIQLSKPISLEKLKNKICQVLPNFQKLLQVPTPVGGYFFWKKVENFDLNSHVRAINGMKCDLDEFMNSMRSAPFPGEALWEIILVNEIVVIFRMHHVLGDGYTKNHFVDALLDVKSPYMVKEENRSWSERFKFIILFPILIGDLVSHAFLDKKTYFTQKKRNSKTFFSSTVLDLSVVRQVRRKLGVHFATLGMSLLGGALTRALKNKAGKEISFMHSLPRSNHPFTMCNHWAVGLFPIPLNKAKNAMERVLEAESCFTHYRNSNYEKVLHFHIPMMSSFPIAIVKKFFSTNFGTSAGFTSVPAYPKEAKLLESDVVVMHKLFNLQWKNSAVAAAAYSYNNRLGYTVLANQDIVGDQKTLDRIVKTYLHDELQELLDKIGQNGALFTDHELKLQQPLSSTEIKLRNVNSDSDDVGNQTLITDSLTQQLPMPRHRKLAS